MVNCPICQKEFPVQWRLNRHLNSKTRCKPIEIEDINLNNSRDDSNNLGIKRTLNLNKTTQMNNKNDITNIKGKEITDMLLMNNFNFRIGLRKEQCENYKKCLYCLKEHIQPSKHRKICKHQFDKLRNIEIDLDITYTPLDNTHCRFCYEYFSTSSSLNRHLNVCKRKKEYTELLQPFITNPELCYKKVVNNNITNNNITNNNITNNNTINNTNLNFYFQDNRLYVNDGIAVNPFGKETLTHLTQKIIEQLIDKANEPSEIKPEIKFIALLMKEIHRNEDIPENYNLEYVNKRNNKIIIYSPI